MNAAVTTINKEKHQNEISSLSTRRVAKGMIWWQFPRPNSKRCTKIFC